jgi:rare lipoprotein A
VPGKHAARQQARTGYAGQVAGTAVVAALLLGGAAGAVKLDQERTGAVIRTGPTAAGTGVVVPTRQPRHGAAPTPTGTPTATPTARAGTPERASRGSTRTKPTPSAAQRTASTVVESGTCGASFYDEPQQTANGETFDPEALTAANKQWAFDTRVRVTNPDTGRSVVVRINDRGPYVDGRCIDLSRAAFRAIADLGLGQITVKYEVLK